MKLKILILSFFIIQPLTGQEQIDTKKIKSEIQPYVEYIKQHKMKPVDYVMRLFKDHDLVILCERSHREITQYDLIKQLMQDQRFINKVGNIYTEIGAINHSKKFSDFINFDNLNDEEIKEYMGDLSLCTYANINWTGVPFFKFLKDVYNINQSLDKLDKIQVYPVNLSFSWDTLSNQNYKQSLKNLTKRDSLCAYQIIESFDSLNDNSVNQQKALVIMNYRHAFNNFTLANGQKMDNVGRFLFDYYGDGVANVMINALRLYPGSKRGTIESAPVQNGKWDAAFASLGNPCCGFDFTDSPFGRDSFDYYPFKNTKLKYKDVFDGFVFYQPLQKHVLKHGIPKLYDNKMEQEIRRRCKIKGYDKDKTEFIIEATKTKVSRSYAESEAFQTDNYMEIINQ